MLTQSPAEIIRRIKKIEIRTRNVVSELFSGEYHSSFKGQGLGKELMRDAMLRTLSAAEIAGLRAIVVDAKDSAAKVFYERYGFEPFKDEPMRLALILKEVRAQLGKK